MNTPSFRNNSVRHSLIATARPVSRRWKKLVTKIKGFSRKQARPDPPVERRHSSDELARKAEFPYYIETEDRKKKETASLHHISMPAGPVVSALSPPPRHTMQRRKLEPVVVRLSIDSDDRPATPFRSGTLGNHNSDGFTIPTEPVPPLKERRKRKSPLAIPDDLTLSLRRGSISTTSSGSSSDYAQLERDKAMDALEGLDRDKAQYDAVVGRRRPTPSLTPSRPYPSSPSSMGTVVEESTKTTPRIPESLRLHRDL
ncbi:hypothetical protein BJV82DRAFT_189567 [Fennellomyces sp. T-0311]|nr:hypothetical protein BJV82DRAFT_189567 [Fennellomyces sp. T-0311]